MTVGNKIKSLRKSMGLTQTELGQRVGVQKNAVSKWECGRVEDIPTSTIKALANLFGVPASYLIDDGIVSSLPCPGDADGHAEGGGEKDKEMAESCIHILRGLISYHERMTMGQYKERDFYLEALRFAIECVEKQRLGGEYHASENKQPLRHPGGGGAKG